MSSKKYFLKKDWLYEKYILEQLSSNDIAKLIGCSGVVVLRNLKKCKIPIRNVSFYNKNKKIVEEKNNIKITKEKLYQYYWVEAKTMKQIAKIFNCSTPTIKNRLIYFDIRTRDRSESKKGNLNPMFGKKGNKNPKYGKKLTTEQAKLHRATRPRGKDHFRYKNPEDRIENLNNQIRNCQKNKKWKIKVLKRDNFSCVLCKKNNKEVKLEIDHIVPFAKLKQKNNIKTLKEAEVCKDFWNVNNGRTLCKKCHRQTKTWGYKKNENCTS